MKPTRRVQPERLAVLREDAGYTIAGLARAMNVGSYTYLGRVERGVVQPSPDYLRRIATVLGVRLDRRVDLDDFTTREPLKDAA